jgi:hypothetical protein
MTPLLKSLLEQELKIAFIGRSACWADNWCMTHTQSSRSVLAFRRVTLPMLTFAILGLAVPYTLADSDDHERARQAVITGQVLPLRTVLEKLEREQAGQVLEVKLERDDGRWIYEIKLLQPGGQLLKLKLDAQNAKLIDQKSKSVERAHR